MIDDAYQKIARFKSRGVLLDSNMLILLLVGTVDPKSVPSSKRTEKYTEGHYQLLVQLLSPIKTFLTTPHVATEVDNLTDWMPVHHREEYRSCIARFIKAAKESRAESSSLVGTKVFESLGLTDAAVFRLSKRKLIVTDDFPLSSFIESSGGHVINFTNLWPYYQK